MAKTPVTFKTDDFEPREVAMVTYNFSQATDKEGQMAGIPRGGKITVRVKALNDPGKQNQLLQWMLDPIKKQDGTITFLKSTDGSTLKTIKFEHAYCVSYTEFWEDKTGGGESLAHYEEIVISCRRITNAQAKFQNQWA